MVQGMRSKLRGGKHPEAFQRPMLQPTFVPPSGRRWQTPQFRSASRRYLEIRWYYACRKRKQASIVDDQVHYPSETRAGVMFVSLHQRAFWDELLQKGKPPVSPSCFGVAWGRAARWVSIGRMEQDSHPASLQWPSDGRPPLYQS